MMRAASKGGTAKESSALQLNSSTQKMRSLLGSISSTETRYLLPSRRKWPDATYCAFTRAAAAAGGNLRSEKAVPRAMTLKPRNLAKPKMMSLVTLSASATLSGAAVNGSKSSVGLRVSAAGELDGASKRAVSIKLTTAAFAVDRRASATSASIEAASMPSCGKHVTDA